MKGKGAESLKSVLKRIRELDSQLGKSKYSNILCVSHGFFLIFVEKFYFDQEELKSNQLTTMTARSRSYLEGFNVTKN